MDTLTISSIAEFDLHFCLKFEVIFVSFFFFYKRVNLSSLILSSFFEKNSVSIISGNWCINAIMIAYCSAIFSDCHKNIL